MGKPPQSSTSLKKEENYWMYLIVTQYGKK